MLVNVPSSYWHRTVNHGKIGCKESGCFALHSVPARCGRRVSPVLPLLLSSRRERVRGGERRLRVPVLQHRWELLLQVRGGAEAGAGREGVRR